MGLTRSITKDNLKGKFARAGFKAVCVRNTSVTIPIFKDNYEVTLTENSIQVIGLYTLEYSYADILGFNIITSQLKIYLNFYLTTGEQFFCCIPLIKMTNHNIERNLKSALFIREYKKTDGLILN